jgi:hypothetical protein
MRPLSVFAGGSAAAPARWKRDLHRWVVLALKAKTYYFLAGIAAKLYSAAARIR